MTYTIITHDGNGKTVTETAFNEALTSGGYNRHTDEDTDTLFPYCEAFTNFCIVTKDDTGHSFGRDVFFALIKAQNQHRDECKKQEIPFTP